MELLGYNTVGVVYSRQQNTIVETPTYICKLAHWLVQVSVDTQLLVTGLGLIRA